jgi:hypothetical protein
MMACSSWWEKGERRQNAGEGWYFSYHFLYPLAGKAGVNSAFHERQTPIKGASGIHQLIRTGFRLGFHIFGGLEIS